MESPPSSTTWSEAFILSDDSGLLLTNGSISSGSMSGESQSGYGRHENEMHYSDCDDKSFSPSDSLDGMSDIMGGENFNTLKKGPQWIDLSKCKHIPIEPPPEFQDKPEILLFDSFASKLSYQILNEAIGMCFDSSIISYKSCNYNNNNITIHSVTVPSQKYWKSDCLPYGSPPSSRNSLRLSRFSSSHNSLSVPVAQKADDSTFITQAVSHDTLLSNTISDLYNVPFDSDMYALPVDVVKPKYKRNFQQKKRRRNTSSCCNEMINTKMSKNCSGKRCIENDYREPEVEERDISKRHSVAGTSATGQGEPIHMTLQEVRHFLQTLYSSSSESSVYRGKENLSKSGQITRKNGAKRLSLFDETTNTEKSDPVLPFNHNFLNNVKNKGKCRKETEKGNRIENIEKKRSVRGFSFKTLCNIFKFKRFGFNSNNERKKTSQEQYSESLLMIEGDANKAITNRALPPLPSKNVESKILDFATSIQKVKDYGWYWGPLSSEAAEKILSNEPDGSFIVRDSSDDHYIFSLTFKLNNSVRHVRIEHDQGNFSFGNCTKFKSQTIVEFIENAVEHSRSGRYLFFIRRGPVIGPVRVQLLHPVSRFKQIQSLQHICRFVILKYVRKDLISTLPLPRRMIDYLSTPHYYSEHLLDVVEESNEGGNKEIRCQFFIN
ncbi:uncharacterized protein LOC108741570 [Agrilus planipennis]|uniref:Uncharacterized protein LOC108741570 n=1 Tax=Agrilus planipennis TaxID=224129 RepID=A0A7F5R684_AGRPL|nr:uncharacterized protein LOC108741570 [Agrilus planipennis]